MQVSNLRPPACKAGALPAELTAPGQAKSTSAADAPIARTPPKIIMVARSAAGSSAVNAPSGIRTRATTLKGWRPRPLVDGGGGGQNSRERCLHWPSGPVAQLVEQGTFNPKVAGSIPARPIPIDPARRPQSNRAGKRCTIRLSDESPPVRALHATRPVSTVRSKRKSGWRTKARRKIRGSPEGDPLIEHCQALG